MVLNGPVLAEEAERDPALSAPADERPLIVPGDPARRAPQRSPAPGLDALLKLPSAFLDGDSREVAGASERVWRSRFNKAQSELDEARAGLERTKRELDSAAEGGGANQWSMAPPGASSSGGPSTSPLSFKLRQEMKENRERLEEAERSMRALRIEAELAGVPRSWRGEGGSSPIRSIPKESDKN